MKMPKDKNADLLRVTKTLITQTQGIELSSIE